MKKFLNILYFLQYLPIPISLITIPATIMSIAATGDMRVVFETYEAFFSMSFFILASSYFIPCIIASINTIIRKRKTLLSFLPIFHIILTLLSLILAFLV